VLAVPFFDHNIIRGGIVMSMTALQKENLGAIQDNLAYSKGDAAVFVEKFGLPLRVSHLGLFHANDADPQVVVIVRSELALRVEIDNVLHDTDGEPALILRIADSQDRLLDIIKRANKYKEHVFPMTLFPLGIDEENIPKQPEVKSQLLCFGISQALSTLEDALRASPVGQVFVLSNAELLHRAGLA